MKNETTFNPIDPSLFTPAQKDDNKERITRPVIGSWTDVFRRLRQNKLAMVGLITIILLLIMAFVGPSIVGFDYSTQDYARQNMEPNSINLFGTDELGRDLFTRVCYGIRYSLLIGILAAAMDFVVGVTYGGVAGMASSRVDNIMMRVAEVVYAIPYLLIVILISVMYPTNRAPASLPWFSP